jgi:hypothetical protein
MAEEWRKWLRVAAAWDKSEEPWSEIVAASWEKAEPYWWWFYPPASPDVRGVKVDPDDAAGWDKVEGLWEDAASWDKQEQVWWNLYPPASAVGKFRQ